MSRAAAVIRMEQPANLAIGSAARAAGVSVKMVRHYEAIGLLPPAERGRGGVRRLRGADVHTLRFIARARALGFSLQDVRRLLSLWQDPNRSNAEILGLAELHRQEMLEKRASLDAMAGALQALIDACAGDGRPECPILEDLAETKSQRARRAG